MTENGIYDQIDLSFISVISKQLRSVTNNVPKTHVETQPREMFLIFRTTPLVVLLMAAVPLVATALYFIQSKTCFQ